MRSLTSDEKTALKMLMDSYGTAEVLDAIADICMEKADHIRSNYADSSLAQRWQDVVQTISKAVYQAQRDLP